MKTLTRTHLHAIIVGTNQAGRRGVVAPSPALDPTPTEEVSSMGRVYSFARSRSSRGGRFAFGAEVAR